MSKKLIQDKTFRIVSPGFNCESSVRFWYNSLRVQSYENWEAYAIDDASDDETSERIVEIAKVDKRVRHIRRNQHYYQLGNWYDVISKFSPKALVIRLDLDDFLGDKYILENFYKEFVCRDVDVFTITEFALDNYYKNDYSARWYQRTVEDVYNLNEHADSLFCFKAQYFQNIPKEMFLDENGDFVRCAGDVAITAPILYQGFYHFHHLFCERGLMYDTIRPPQYNDDNLVDNEGKRLQFIWRDKFLERFRKYVDEGVFKVYA